MTVRREAGRTGGPAVLAAAGVALLALLAGPPARAATVTPSPTSSAGSATTPTGVTPASTDSTRAGGSGSCPVTVNISGGNSGLTLTPDRARVDLGACVTFANTTNGAVDVQVDEGSKSWAQTVSSGTSDDYPAGVAGSHDVSVKQHTPLFPASGSGTVRVSRPTASPSASGSPPPSGHRSNHQPASRRQSGHRHRSATRHRSAKDRRRHGRHGKNASTKIALPPLNIPPGVTAAPYRVSRRGDGSLPRVAGPQAPPDPAAATPSAVPSPDGSVQAAAPRISPGASGGSAGADLALAVGGLLALGQLAALLRVLAAVDNRRRGVGGGA